MKVVNFLIFLLILSFAYTCTFSVDKNIEDRDTTVDPYEVIYYSVSDSLSGSTKADKHGGSFTEGGWKTVDEDDYLLYDLGNHFTEGKIQVSIYNFDPYNQCENSKIDFLAAYEEEHGKTNTATENSTSSIYWRSGTNYFDKKGLKIGGRGALENSFYELVPSGIPELEKDKDQVFRFEWDETHVRWFINDHKVKEITLSYKKHRYVFVGHDFLPGNNPNKPTTCPGMVFKDFKFEGSRLKNPPGKMQESPLAVSANNKYLTLNDQPWFYMGDTVWFLFTLKEEAVNEYFNQRKGMTFNALQLHITPHYNDDMNFYGELPYYDNDPLKPNKAYWDHIRWCMQKIEDNNLRAAIIVGHAIHQGSRVRPYAIDPDNHFDAYKNGWLIGRELGKFNDIIIWVGGFDYNIETTETTTNVNAQMEGIADAINGLPPSSFDNQADYSTTMMTLHPPGRKSSSLWVHNEPWLDFNWYQTYGNLDLAISMLKTDLNKSPGKPSMLAEGTYEATPISDDAPVRYYHQKDGNRITYASEYGAIQPWHIRYQAYQTVFTGAAGYGYGHRGLIQTINEEDSRQLAYSAPGGAQMSYFKKLVEDYKFWNSVPDNSIITEGQNNGEETAILAFRDSEKKFALVYTTMGRSFKVDLNELVPATINAKWLNPRDGTKQNIGSYSSSGTREFNPPGSPEVYNDWILILEAD